MQELSISKIMDSNTKNKEVALTKAIVYWKEPLYGRESDTFFSYDKPADRLQENHLPGMAGLVKRIVQKKLGRYKNVIIYRNGDGKTGEKLRQYNEEGKLV